MSFFSRECAKTHRLLALTKQDMRRLFSSSGNVMFRTEVKRVNFRAAQQPEQTFARAAASANMCVDFSDHNAAFKHKPTKEILRAWFVFKLCCLDFFVDNSMKIFNMSSKVLGERFLHFLLKPTLYTHFGVVETEDDVSATVAELQKLGMRPLLSPMLEEDVGQEQGNKSYDEILSRVIRCVELTSQLCTEKPKCLAVKLTAILPASLLAAISSVQKHRIFLEKQEVDNVADMISDNSRSPQGMMFLKPNDEEELLKAVKRLRRLGNACLNHEVTLFVDAEHSYLQPAVRLLTLGMMASINKQTATIWNTYQCYLKKSFDHVQNDLQLSQEMGFWFGGKIVRGAYMEIEKEYARASGEPYPLNESYEKTTNMYHSVMDLTFHHMTTMEHRCAVIFATHNEESVIHALRRMHQCGIHQLTGGVHFGQQGGMCDHVSLTLGRKGYSIYKLIPVGSVVEVLPWLSRRANENRSISIGARRDRDILWNQLKSRLRPWKKT